MNQSLRSRRWGGMLVGLIVCLILAGITGWVGYSYWYDGEETISADSLITSQVSRGPFDHIVLEQGEIESSSNIEIVCQVESRGSSGTQILWVIDEGARVKAGDKLVELDASALEQELKEDRLQVMAATSNVKTAEAVLEQAKIAKQEYIEGVYMTERAAIESEMAIAEQDLSKAQLALESTERLVAKGLVKELQLQADKFAVFNATNKLAAAKQKLEVLGMLTLKKMMVQYDSDIESAEATLAAARSALQEETTEMEERQRQIESCVMYAPSDGVVVHANRYSSRGGNAEFVVEPGAIVRERQAIIRLPDPTKMQVNCKVNESQVTLLQAGMPAKISIDALPDLKLRGRVAKVNRYAEPGGWMSSSVKEYATIIEILDPPEEIRTGMNAAVQIFVEQLPEALQIPIQGLYEHGGEMYTLVRKPGTVGAVTRDQFETRSVKIGATNDTMASIRDGLQEGESVILNLRQHLTLMDLPEIEREDNSDLDDIRQQAEAERALAGNPAAGGPDDGEGPAVGEGRRRGGPGGRGGSPGDGPRRNGAPGAGPRPGGGAPGAATGDSTDAGKPADENSTAEEDRVAVNQRSGEDSGE